MDARHPSSGPRRALSAIDSTADVEAIVAEQVALRRVATLTARRVPLERLFAAVNQELAQSVGADATAVLRFEPEETVTLVAAWNAAGAPVAVGEQEPVNAALRRLRDCARPIRCGPADVPLTGPFIGEIRKLGIRATVAVPIQVDDRVWGVSVVASESPEPFPGATEDRMIQFAELVAIAVGNAQNWAALEASRARVIAAADESRRGIQRDLHDGARQHVVNTVLRLKLAQTMLAQSGHPALEVVSDALDSTERAAADLRELIRRVLPSALRYGDLRGAINALIQHIDVPVSMEIASDRLPAHLETTAYFVIAETLTNADKHARATRVDVRAAIRRGALQLEISDDGIGGARLDRGTGLVGLADRVESIGGQITIASPPGAGTTVAVSLPTE